MSHRSPHLSVSRRKERKRALGKGAEWEIYLLLKYLFAPNFDSYMCAAPLQNDKRKGEKNCSE